jgi:phosphocarrier protein
MLTQKVLVENTRGLHLRVAAKIVETCKKYQADVLLCKHCQQANGCSVLDLLMLDAPQGTELHLVVEGRDEAQALAALAEVFEHGGGI